MITVRQHAVAFRIVVVYPPIHDGSRDCVEHNFLSVIFSEDFLKSAEYQRLLASIYYRSYSKIFSGLYASIALDATV